ncbi:MAG: hypothetical protein HYX69_07195 [Planctomycetia bacterium]|nr:hypothetical protein [Planctomycetia bacterium]
MSDNLSQFIEHARAKGMDHATISLVLRRDGRAFVTRRFLQMMGLFLALMAGSAASAAEHPDEDYYDRSLPQSPGDIPIKPFDGERYEAEVPDTLDLAYHATEALNFLTRCIAPESKDYCIFHLMHGQFNPCIFEIGHGSNQNQNAKWAESVELMRAVTGSDWNIDGDRKLMASLVRFTGPDGLFYVPVKDRPWAYIDPVTQKAGKPFADAFAEGRQLRALATWYEHDKNPLWKKIADRKVKRLAELAIKKGDTLYFKLARGYSPWYVETGEGPVAALGDVGQVFDNLTGDAAANMICWMPQAAVTWYRVTGNTDALRLARGLARYLYEDEVFFDRAKGKFHNYGTFFTHAMNSICSYALVADDKEMIDWVKLGLDQFLEHNDPDRTGMMTMHACDYADMMQVMCMLSRAGHGDYWEDLDRWIRNGFDWRQITQADVDGMNNRPVTRMGDPKTTATLNSMAYWVKGELPLNRDWPHLLQPDDGNERVRGACGGAGCCQGNLTRACYLCWDSILEARDEQLTVNLLLNRASPWADVTSWVPCEGKAVIKMKKPMKQVLLRIPRWVDRTQLVCTVDGREIQPGWADKDYLNAGPMRGGEEIQLAFPVHETTKETRMTVAGGNRLGTLKIDYLAVSKVADDFTGRAAGKLDAPGAGNNTGAGGMTWRWNAGMAAPALDGQGALELPVTGNWNQYIDTVTMPPFVLGGQDATFVAIFQKSGAGDVAMGFIRDLTWDGGERPKGQRLFKIKDNKLYVSNLYESAKTDEETGVAIKSERPQGLMIKKDAKGDVTWFYQDGGDKDPASAAWKNVTPQSSSAGNLEPFAIDLGHIGINSLGEGTKKSTVTMKGNTAVAISENIMGYPIGKHAKYRQDKAAMKKVRRFATDERFIWY